MRTTRHCPEPFIIAGRRAATHARRGVAMMMVLSVVAAAAVLAWAMLASSTMRSQVDDNAVDAVEAVSIAESGVSYAMHCLHYPERVRPGAADPVTWFYPGELGLKPWSDARGTVDIVVTNTALGKYKIRATASVVRGSNVSAAKHTVEADVTTQLQGIVNAAGFNGGMTIPTNMNIVGPVVASGALGNFSTQVTGSPALVVATDNVVPPASRVALLVETANASTITGALSTDRTYTYNGNTYIAEKAPTTIGILTNMNTSRPTLNPCNVWYSSSNVLLNGANFTGVLVLRDTANLRVAGTNTVTAPSGMPALVVANNINLESTALINAKLTVKGAAWVGQKIAPAASTPNRTTAAITIDGALLMGAASPAVQVAANVNVTYKASSVATVRRLSTVPTITGVTIDSWKSVD
jgi:hypothetical protein